MALQLIKIDQFPQVTVPEDWIVVAKGDGVAYKISRDDFKDWLGTVQVVTPKPISPSDPVPTLAGIYIPTEDGEYPGGIEVDLSEGYNQLVFDGTTWTKIVSPIDLTKYETFIDESLSNKDIISASKWELGSIQDDGTEVMNVGRVRTKYAYRIKKGSRIYLPSYTNNLLFIAVYSQADNSFIRRTPQLREDYIAQEDELVRIVVGDDPAHTVTNIADLSDLMRIDVIGVVPDPLSVSVFQLGYDVESLITGVPAVLPVSYWEVGNLNPPNGAKIEGLDKIRMKSLYKVKKGTVFGFSDYSDARFRIFIFDADTQLFIENDGYRTTDYEVADDCYVSVVLSYIVNKDITDISELSDIFELRPPRSGSGAGISLNSLDQSVISSIMGESLPLDSVKWSIGSITPAGAEDNAQLDKIRTNGFIRAYKGQTIGMSEYARYKFLPVIYDLEDQALVERGSFITERYTIAQDCWIRVVLGYLDDRPMSGTDDPIITKLSIEAGNRENYWNALPVTVESRIKEKWGASGNQGMTLMRNEIWHMTPSEATWDDHVNYGNIVRRDFDTKALLTPVQHNLGHGSSIDYSLENDALLFGNGSWDDRARARIDILPNASSWVGDSTPADIVYGSSDVISIPFFTSAKDLGAQCVACWGEDRRIIYVVTGGNFPTTIYRVFLGTGSNDFSDQTGGGTDETAWGTFIAGKGADEFNGTAKVLSKHKCIQFDADHRYRQGIQFHNGEIWLLTGYNRQYIMRITCMDDGTFRTSAMVEIQQYNADGTKWTYEPQGMFISYPYAYVYLYGTGANKAYAIPIHGIQGGKGNVGVKVDFDFPLNYTPVIKITPLSATTDLYVLSVDHTGFTVQSTSGGSGNFLWECNS